MARTPFPPQTQERQPGLEAPMRPSPEVIRDAYRGSDKLQGRVALITGGDSGIGRAVAVHFAREGADVAIVYLDEHQDARDTEAMVKQEGQDCLLISGDLQDEGFCRQAIQKTIDRFGHLEILVNNAAVQYPQEDLRQIKREQLEKTFRTNIFAMFALTQAALVHLKSGASILNTTSIQAFRGSGDMVDYASTKGAILTFTRALAKQLVRQGIRVNAVAPGPIWTPIIPASFSKEEVAEFGKNTPMGRAGQPSEVAPAYVFLASEDASYITGQVIQPNGGEVVGD